MSAVDHSEGLKVNLEEEGALLQDFHIVFTCKVGAFQDSRANAAHPHVTTSHLRCGQLHVVTQFHLLCSVANDRTPQLHTPTRMGGSDWGLCAATQTLTALQQARLEVGAFPCLPDAMTVCGLLADQSAGKRLEDMAGKAAARDSSGGTAHEDKEPKQKEQKHGNGGESSVRARSL